MPLASISSIFTDNSGALRAKPHSHALRLIVATILPPAPINAVVIDICPIPPMPNGADSIAFPQVRLCGTPVWEKSLKC